MIGSGLAWWRKYRCFFYWRRCDLNFRCFHAWPRTPLMPHPYLSLHTNAYFHNVFGFPTRHTSPWFWHVTFAIVRKRLACIDPTIFTTGKDMFQRHMGQWAIGRFCFLRLYRKQTIVFFDQFRKGLIGVIIGGKIPKNIGLLFPKKIGVISPKSSE